MKILKSKICALTLITALGLCLAVSDIASAQVWDEGATVPLNFDSQYPLIEAQVNGKAARLVYDSGASHLALFEQSFPELGSEVIETVEGAVFGGDQTAQFKILENVNVSWSGIELKLKTGLVDYAPILPNVNDAPFFEGIITPVKINKGKRESVTVFDVPNKNIVHLPVGEKVKFEASESFKFTRKKNGRWRVKMPVMLEGETEKRTLNLIVDTGAAQSLILSRDRLNIKNNATGYAGLNTGLGGVSDSAYGGRTTFFIGEDTVKVDTNIFDNLPDKGKVDGYIGWGFLKRFRTAFDVNKKRMIIDLEDADFADDKVREASFKAGGAPMPDWTGMLITHVGSWASSGLQAGDVLTSVDGIKLSPSAMYSVIKNAQDQANLCWKRADAVETCAKAVQG